MKLSLVLVLKSKALYKQPGAESKSLARLTIHFCISLLLFSPVSFYRQLTRPMLCKLSFYKDKPEKIEKNGYRN